MGKTAQFYLTAHHVIQSLEVMLSGAVSIHGAEQTHVTRPLASKTGGTPA
jgi:hypothetical protein